MNRRMVLPILLATVGLMSCGSNNAASNNGGSSNGSGTPTPSAATLGEWAWVNGSDTTGQAGTYGVQGTAAPGNVPGARNSSVAWTDASGDFWLFGGIGHDSTGAVLPLNDLWKFSRGQWTWMGGSNIGDQPGTYGTQGVAAPSNIPGGRWDALGWIDATGSLWLFGGFGLDVGTPFAADLSDLWRYSAGQWTWMSGPNVINQVGSYGTQGLAVPGNVPGARAGAIGWADSAGNLWLFGGAGFDSNGTNGSLNDLWKYNSGEWTWVGGSNVADQPGTYGAQGVAAPSNMPAARSFAAAWSDASGDFWLFGGSALDSAGAERDLNDLWRYSSGQWTWVSGSNVTGQPGVYGTEGVPSAGNVPGARDSAVAWVDSAGNLWLFGGETLGSDDFSLNDLWSYAAGQWTWMGGADTVNELATYGTLGIAAAGNMPGARDSAVGWCDASGSLWLFSGYGLDSGHVTQGNLNDLWEFQP
jgi:N-acetylneuraminic acid mutarotase